MDTGIFGEVENYVAQVSGASFFCMGIAVGQLPRLVADTGNCGNMRMDCVHYGTDFFLSFLNLRIQFPNECNGMFQFQRLAGIAEPMEFLAVS